MNRLKLIIGLGNPGSDYSKTRHNAGYWWIQKLCLKHSLKLKPAAKFFSLMGVLDTAAHNCLLALPSNYMNNSGSAVALIASYYNILPHEILIIHDDLDLDCGTARYKLGGGHGGHNGLRDILAKLPQTKDFYRLRIGIGHPGNKTQVVNYVLGRPNKDEQDKIEQVIDTSISHLDKLLQGDWQFVMQQLN